MRNTQLVDGGEEAEEEQRRWKRLCLRELGAGGLKKLRRKGKEPAKAPLDGARASPAGSKVPEHVLAGRTGAPAAPRLEVPAGAFGGAAERPDGGGCGEAVDLRKHVFPAALLASHPPPSRKDTCLRSVGLNGAESQAFPPEQTLPSRRMACPPPPPPPEPHPHRALESAYASVSHVIYRGHPESSLSPRKRPGEAAAVPSEIKAIQQTRRLLANARERTRVHTISAAFEALRKQVPCYSYGQKLSKLAILRIACNYILSLAKLADLDYSADHSNVSFSECVEQCTRTLQAEGRSKKRKE